MVQFGRGGAMHPDSERSLRAALFTSGEFQLTSSAWSDRERDWAEPKFLETEPDGRWMLRNLGERGLLERFSAVLWARPKAWSLDNQLSSADSALAEYNPKALLVTGPDFGHTDPQVVLPYGGNVDIDPASRRITVTY
ncbi:hypothetical protein [Kribbella alba]